MPKVLVVGGGAAGMMAAISARNQGADVIILERNNRVGRKILATGNGRCNYTNVNLSIENYHGENKKFPYSCLSQFNVDETINFFEVLGITPAIEEDGKVFPLSFQSSSVLDVLRFELEYLDIEVMTEAYVVDIKNNNNNFILTLKDGREIYGDRVILATGGNAAPNTGSDGNGYVLAQELGHSLIEVFPGLVQLKLEGDLFKQVDGVKFIGTAGLYDKNKLLKEDSGDILFTNYGISGPPILQLSRTALYYLKKGKSIQLKVSIIHTRTQEELFDYLQYRFGFMPKKTIEIGLIGLINKRLILPILNETAIDKNKLIAHLSNEEVRKISAILTDLRFNIIGSKSWDNAQITAGGIVTNEIENSTMESKLVKGLFFAGEIMDIDGDCGGFNLQWAWSSGYVAGRNASLR
ncbi:NAD(P)/FAD-dependent oxidoreductase [Clostridium sp. Cult2]|uniref:NAD(P)/FAD-dependent oxidoreductase n=1 Tax=Clostridium sp. Cult2 TaxID=2079003 RepID=UPI001F45CD9F|nr:NAD(P)/FAD-dependent oxidoreductase [Clostridium sp. Cult2]MCF6465826.1 aminoacetone oxidase family FAD-binding enzyme [Clostridium sp. Cult2]